MCATGDGADGEGQEDGVRQVGAALRRVNSAAEGLELCLPFGGVGLSERDLCVRVVLSVPHRFIVYSESQVKQKYVLTVKFKYKSYM